MGKRGVTAAPRRIGLTAFAVLALGCAMFVLLAEHRRQEDIDTARLLAASLANATAQRIGGNLRAIDILLADAAAQAHNPGAIGADTIRLLRSRMSAVPELLNLSIADAQGIIRARTDNAPPGLDASRGANFIFHKQHAGTNSLSIVHSPPHGLDESGFLLLSRPVAAGGRFLGLVQVRTVPTFLTAPLSAILPDPDGAAGIYDSDAVPLAQLPPDCAVSDRAFASVLRQMGGDSPPKSAIAACPDGKDRIFGIARVPHYPFVVAVGISREAVLGQWWEEEKSHGVIELAFAAFTFLLAWTLARSERERAMVHARLAEADRRHMETLSTAVEERTAELGEAMAALRESEERFRAIVDTSPLPLVLTRVSDGQVAYINEDATRTFSVPSKEGLKKRAHDFYDHPEDRDRLKDAVIADGHVRDFETTLMRASGERFVALLSASSFMIGGELMMLTAVHDITESKRLNEELARSNAELEQFSYAVSHDLQEPLRMVSSYLTLLERRYRGRLDNEARDFIAFAVEGSQRMSRMITDLLEYSRVRTRGAQFSTVDLGHALGDALANLAALIEATDATIKADPLPTITGDASQLMRLLQNLIGNALKYRRNQVAPEIRIAIRQDGEDWTVSVSDNGIGIDPAQTGRLFQVFQRLHSRTEYEGTGVGLALCRRIVERHGGRIWAESAGTDQGCTFHFTVPVTPVNRARG
ncbi:MAG: ATP-binding protein [Magnetospirillum sp.]|nr:ATP-binding protein [Magnetospirillum sp.]